MRGLGVVHILVGIWCLNRALTVLPCPRVCSRPALQGWQGGRYGPTSPPAPSLYAISSPNEVPWGPSHNWISGSKVSTWTFQISPGSVLASGPHRQPTLSWGPHTKPPLHSCLASSGTLCVHSSSPIDLELPLILGGMTGPDLIL